VYYLKTYVLIYETFVQFEVVLTNYFMKTKGEIVTVGVDDKEVTSWEGFKTVPHLTIEEVDTDDVDLFVVPGGQPDQLTGIDKLSEFLNKLYQKNKVLAAICAAPVHFAKAGILKKHNYTTTLPLNEFNSFNKQNFLDRNVVVDENIITAKAAGYVDFALEVGKKMNIFKDQADYQETVNFFKYYNNQ